MCLGLIEALQGPLFGAVTAFLLCPSFIWWLTMSLGSLYSYLVTHQELTWSLQQVGLLSTEA